MTFYDEEPRPAQPGDRAAGYNVQPTYSVQPGGGAQSAAGAGAPSFDELYGARETAQPGNRAAGYNVQPTYSAQPGGGVQGAAGAPSFDELYGARETAQPGNRAAEYNGQPTYSVQPPRARRGRGVLAGFGYFGIYLAVQVVASMAFSIALVLRMLASGDGLDVAVLLETVTGRAVLLTGVVNLITILVYFIMFAARKKSFFVETGLTRVNVPRLLIILPLAFTAYVFVASALSLLPESVLAGYEAAASGVLGGTDVLSVLCIALVAPFAEEIIFRGLLYSRLKRAMPALLAALIASAVFGVMHGQPVWMAYAFLLSLLLVALSEWYGSLWAAVLMHVCFNSAEYVVPTLLTEVPVLPACIASAALLVPLLLAARACGKGCKKQNGAL